MRLVLLAAAMSAPAAAQSVQFSAVAGTEVGYATNPFLASGVDKGGLTASASIAPRLQYQTARSNTILLGRYERQIYSNGFGYSDDGSVGVTRTDQLSQFLSSTLTGSYLTSNRDTINDPDAAISNPFDVGRRTKTLAGSDQLQWQASARDQISFGSQISHQSYGKSETAGLDAVASEYTQYGTNASYNHNLDARTSIGAQVNVSAVRSALYPDSRTIQPALTARRQINAIWVVDGHIGVVFSRVEGPLPKSTKSLGLGLNLCGTYPRTNICVKLSRDTAPSGFGPLRTTSSIAVNVRQDLTERSHLGFTATFVRDSSGAFETAPAIPVQTVRNGKLLTETVSYDRDITQRISAGFGGQLKWRELSGYQQSRSYQGTIHVTAKLGRM